jgi:hypothetical protein
MQEKKVLTNGCNRKECNRPAQSQVKINQAKCIFIELQCASWDELSRTSAKAAATAAAVVKQLPNQGQQMPRSPLQPTASSTGTALTATGAAATLNNVGNSAVKAGPFCSLDDFKSKMKESTVAIRKAMGWSFDKRYDEMFNSYFEKAPNPTGQSIFDCALLSRKTIGPYDRERTLVALVDNSGDILGSCSQETQTFEVNQRAFSILPGEESPLVGLVQWCIFDFNFIGIRDTEMVKSRHLYCSFIFKILEEIKSLEKNVTDKHLQVMVDFKFDSSNEKEMSLFTILSQELTYRGFNHDKTDQNIEGKTMKCIQFMRAVKKSSDVKAPPLFTVPAVPDYKLVTLNTVAKDLKK